MSNEEPPEIKAELWTADNTMTRKDIISARFVQLSSESTAHGYHNIFRTKFTSIRIMWIFFFLFSVGCCAFLMFSSINGYLKYEVTTKVRLEYHSSLNFPMISICNSKPFTTQPAYDFSIKQMLKTIKPRSFDSGQISVLYGNYTNAAELTRFNNDMRPYISSIQHQVADPGFNDTLRQTLGLTWVEFKSYTTFNRQPFSDDYFVQFYDPNYGNCFKFNSGFNKSGKEMPIFQQKEPGQSHGLFSSHFIDVFTNQTYNFLNLLNSYTVGIKISVDDQDTIPIYFNNMIPIQPGACTFIGLKKTISKSLPYPYSSCQDLTNYQSILYDKFVRLNKTYSQQVCYKFCKQMKIINECGCAVIYYPNFDNYSTCTSLEQIKCSYYLALNMSIEGCDEYCPLECEATYYDYTTATDLYPTEVIYEMFKASPRNIKLFADRGVAYENITFDAYSNSLACFYVYFDQLSFTRIEESASMTIIDLFAAIGGSVGLCCGVSIMSFFELIEIVIEIMYIVADRKYQVQAKQKI